MDKQTENYLLDLVRKNYEDIAADFDLTRKKQLRPELLELTEGVKDGDKVLDVGCGNGRLVEAFKNKKIDYLGVDGSKKLIEAGRKNFSSPNLKFLVNDILELDKLSEKDFDQIFCLGVLHHLPGEAPRVKALEQMKNKLAPNGKISLTVWNLWTQKKFFKLIFKYALLKLIGSHQMGCGDILFSWKNSQGQSLSQRYYHAFTETELRRLTGLAGLKIERLSHDKYNYYLVLHK